MKINTLQIYFDSFINQKKQWDFLLGMADYIELLLNDKDCKKYLSDIPKLKKEFQKENAELDKMASEKVRMVKNEYSDLAKESRKSNKPDISVKDLDIEVKTNPEISEVEKKIKEGESATLWDAWDKMCLAYLAVFKKDDVITEIEKQDEYDAWILKNNPELVQQMEEIGSYDKDKKLRHLPALPGVIIGENYKLFATKVHDYLLKKLEDSGKTQEDNENVAFEINYTKYRRILINGIEIKKLRMDSKNDLFFKQVYENANKEVKIDIEPERAIHEYINNIGFRGNAKKVFFQAHHDSVLLHNPVTKDDIFDAGLKGITLDKLFPWIKESVAK